MFIKYYEKDYNIVIFTQYYDLYLYDLLIMIKLIISYILDSKIILLN